MATTEVAQLKTGAGTWDLYVPLPPVPAARPRVGRWGTYYPKTYSQWRTEFAASISHLETPVEVIKASVYVVAHSVAKRPKKLVRAHPRGDVDNYSKALLDAVTRSGLIWKDDDQVVVLYTTKRYAEEGEQPHARLRVTLGGPGDLPSAAGFVSEDALDHAVSFEELEDAA